MLETRVFSVRRDRKVRPATPEDVHEFFVVESVDWVNVIPITANDEVVMIEHYRHGSDETRLEVPGGMIDPEDPSAAVAASRELEEETGYASDPLIELGVVSPNPALQVNRCTSFLAPNAYVAGPPSPDETEDLKVVLYPLSEIPALMRDGRITHALVLAAFHWLSLRV